MAKKKTMASKNENITSDVMSTIIGILPIGYTVKNKNPQRKSIAHVGSHYPDIAWTSWVQDSQGGTALAVLKGQEIKLIPSDEIKANYLIKNI